MVQLLVERADLRMHAVEVRLRPNGLSGLVREVAAEGGPRHEGVDGLGRRRDDHRPHSAHVQEARRAEAGGDAGRRGVGAAAARRQRHGQGAGAGVPVAEDAGRRRYPTIEDLARSEARARDICQPSTAADAAGAGDRGGNPRWAAAGVATAGRSASGTTIGVEGANRASSPGDRVDRNECGKGHRWSAIETSDCAKSGHSVEAASLGNPPVPIRKVDLTSLASDSGGGTRWLRPGRAPR